MKRTQSENAVVHYATAAPVSAPAKKPCHASRPAGASHVLYSCQDVRVLAQSLYVREIPALTALFEELEDLWEDTLPENAYIQ